MINFYVTPTGKLEYLVGKQLPMSPSGSSTSWSWPSCR